MTSASARLRTWLPRLAILVLLSAVWVPFGLWKTGLIEDWAFYEMLDSHVPLAAMLTQQSNRPLIMLGWAVGYVLSPDSFVGLNIVNLVLMAADGLLLLAIISSLRPSMRLLAFWAAALFMIYPADRDLFATRATNYHVAVAFYLLAVYCLISFWRTKRGWLLVAAIIALAINLATIEVSYPLVVAAPAILLLFEYPPSRRWWRTAAVWWSVPALLVLIAAANALRAGSYQQHVLSMEKLTVTERIGSAVFHFGRAYFRTLIDVWREVIVSGPSSPLYVYIGAFVAALILAVTVLLFRAAPDIPETNLALAAGAIGLAVIGLGFLMFLPLPHRAFNERVFLFSDAGAALVVASIVWWIASHGRLGRIAAAILIAALTGIASVGALNLHAQAASLSLEEQSVLASIAAQMPAPPPSPAVVLIFDPSDYVLYSIWHGASSVPIASSVRYLYKDPALQVYLCDPEKGQWGVLHEACRFGPDGVEITSNGRLETIDPYVRIVAFDAQPDATVKLLDRLPSDAAPFPGAAAYQPRALIAANAAPPQRVHSLLVSWPFKMRPLHQCPSEHIEYTFDTQPPGLGWWQPSGGVAWTNSAVSTLDLLLVPHHDYLIEFRIASALSPKEWDGLMVTANNQPVSLSCAADRNGGRVYRGRVYAATIDQDAGYITIYFRAPRIYTPQELGINDDPRHIGLEFDWFRAEQARSIVAH